ncbi:uncharacterized protein LOC117583923 [Drosophila guanche]|uniref:uncharacterized protein LOC117583923 n=1 Tax=Drosophila guanche TaxID=7266 RepID=UPI0014723303|nr:uncharacterized protein LOC117583923 [Drosophila guanche]
MNKHTNIRNSDISDFGESILRRTVKNPEQFELAYYHEAADQNMALKQVSQKYNKPSYNRTTDPKFESISTRKKKKSTQFDNSNNKNTHSFEEIHEHIDETYDSGSQYQASEPFESETLPHTNVENKTNKKHRNHVKTKIKHHHHHHHHNHIKELIKTIPQPYSVEKVVHVPIEKVVEKVVHVPKFINVTIEKIVHVPIEKIVEKVIHIPKPYVVEKLVEKIIHVPKPYPVLRTVPYPIEIKVPIQVEKKVPFPYKVEIERKVPVYIQTKEPYTFEKSSTEHYSQFDQPKFNIERDHHSSQFDQPKFNIESGLGNHHYNRVYKFKEQKIPNKIEDLQYTVETKNNKHLENSGSQQYASASENMPWKFVGSNSQLLVNMNNEGQGKPPKFHIESDNMGAKEYAKSTLPPKHVQHQLYNIKEINLPYNAANFQKTFQPEQYQPSGTSMSWVEQVGSQLNLKPHNLVVLVPLR